MREMPADFVEVAQSLHLHILKLRRHYHVADRTIYAWLSQTGLKEKKAVGRNCYRAPVPDDFAKRCESHTRRELMAHYGVSKKKLGQWMKESGATPQPCPNNSKKPVPDDFADMCKALCLTQLVAHYGGGESKVYRWLRETGLKPAKSVYQSRPATPKQIRQRRAASSNLSRMGTSYVAVVDHHIKVKSIYDCAADALRRDWVVYRSNKNGIADLKGEYWRVGNTVLTPDELLAKASRYEKRAA